MLARIDLIDSNETSRPVLINELQCSGSQAYDHDLDSVKTRRIVRVERKCIFSGVHRSNRAPIRTYWITTKFRVDESVLTRRIPSFVNRDPISQNA